MDGIHVKDAQRDLLLVVQEPINHHRGPPMHDVAVREDEVVLETDDKATRVAVGTPIILKALHQENADVDNGRDSVVHALLPGAILLRQQRGCARRTHVHAHTVLRAGLCVPVMWWMGGLQQQRRREEEKEDEDEDEDEERRRGRTRRGSMRCRRG